MYAYTTQPQVRAAFWEHHSAYPEVSRRKIGGDYDATTRSYFVDFVDMLARGGMIPEKLADRVTL